VQSGQHLLITVVTPIGLTLKQEAVSVTLQTTSGQIEILSGHVPMITTLEPGEMQLHQENARMEFFAVGEGFAEIWPDRVTVFSDLAENAETIIVEATEEAVRRAQEELAASLNLTDEERRSAELAVKENLVKIQVGLRRKGAKMGKPAME
jgi:F-type H+-transporting ATPase subunit epsilon